VTHTEHMDTIASTHGWELLAELALYGQNGSAPVDAAQAAGQLADLLGRHLAASGGRVELTENAELLAAADWGDYDESDQSGIPIVVDARTLGCVRLGSSSNGGTLDPVFVSALSAQLGLLLYNRTRAAERQIADQLRELVEQSAESMQRAAGSDMPGLAEQFLERVAQVCGFAGTALYLCDHTCTGLNLYVHQGAAFTYPVSLDSSDSHPIARAVVGSAVLREPIPPAHRRQRGKARPAVIVPLSDKHAIAGALVVLAPSGADAVGEHQVQAAQMLAEACGVMLRVLRQSGDDQRRARELFVLFENSETINSSTQIDTLLCRAIENIALALQAEYCAACLIEPQSRLTLQVVASYSESGRETFEMGQTLILDDWSADQIDTGTPLLIDLQSAEHSSLLSATPFADEYRTAMLVPLRHRRERVGVLILGYLHAPQAIEQSGRHLVQVLANQLAAAVVNRRLYQKEQRRGLELQFLQRFSQRLTVDLSRDEILDAIIEEIQSLPGFHGARITLIDPYDQMLHVAVACGLHANEQTIVDTLSMWLARFQRPLNVDDLQNPPEHLSDLGIPTDLVFDDGNPARAFLGLPLRVANGLIGTLEIMAGQPGAFDDDDARLMQIVAGQAAQVIVNASRHTYADSSLHSRVEQLRALQRVSSQLAITLDQKEILEFVLEQALKATGASRGLIALRADPEAGVILDLGGDMSAPHDRDNSGSVQNLIEESLSPAGQTFVIIEAVGYDAATRSKLLHQQLAPAMRTAWRALAQREAELSETLDDTERRLVDAPEAGSALAAPIFYQAGAAGVVLLLAPAANVFDHDAVEFLRALTHQAAVGIGNAQRYAELEHLAKMLQRRAAILNNVLEIGQALRADQSLESLLEQIGYSTLESANYRTILFCLVDPEHNDVLRPVVAAGIPLNELDRMAQGPLPEALAVRYLDPRYRIGRCYYVPAAEASELEAGFSTAVFSYVSFDDERSADEWQSGDRLCVPLYSTEGSLLGVMFAGDPLDRHRPSQRTVEPLEIFADQAAIFIENYYLLRDARARAEQQAALFQVGVATSSTTDLETLLERVYQEIVAHLGTPSFFFISSFERETQQIRFELFKRQGEIVVDSHKRSTAKAGLSALIIDSARPLLIADLQADPGLRAQSVLHGESSEQVRSWLGVPLISQGQVIGVLSVQDFRAGAFGSQDLQFLSTLANQLAVAMENARLFREREQQVDQLALLNRVAMLANAVGDAIQVYQVVVDAMAEATGVDQARLLLYNRELGEARAVAEYAPSGMLDQVWAPMTLPAFDWINTQRQPLVLDGDNDAMSLQAFPSDSPEILASALIPLVVSQVVIGTVRLDFVARSGGFSPQSIELCQTIANQTGTAIARTMALDEAQRNARALQDKVGELSTLIDAASILSSLLRPEEVLNKLMELVSRQLHVTTVALWTIGDDAVLTPAAMDGISERVGSSMRVPVGQGFTGRVAETGEPLVIEDVNAEGGSLYPKFQRKNNLISFMGVPVVYQEQTIGVLSVMSDFRRRFSSDEITLLVGLADQAATALVNARLFQQSERRIRELSAINRISAEVNAILDPQDLLEQLHRGIGEILDVSTSLIGLYDQASDTLAYAVAFDRGVRIELAPQPLRAGTNAHAIRTGQPLLLQSLDDAHARGLIVDDYRVGDDERIEQSYLVSPIVYGERVLGVINIQSYEPYAFNQDDLRFLTTVANQAAVALNNANLFGETSQSASEMTTLFEVSQQLSGILDPDEVQQVAASAALRLIGVDLAVVARLGPDDQFLNQIVLDQAKTTDLQIDFRLDGWTAQLFEREQPLAVNDLLAVDDPNPAVLELGVRSALGVTIGTYEDRLGVIWVGQRSVYPWSERQTRLIAILANQVGQALKSAQLFQLEQARRLLSDTMRDVAQSFTSTLSLPAIQSLILDQLARVVHYDSAAVLLRDEGYGYLQITEARGLDDPLVRAADFAVDEIGLFETMARERAPVLIEDTLIDPLYTPILRLGWNARSWIGAPMLVDNELVGLLAIGAERSSVYTNDDMQVAFALANQASQAIQNARLFDQISNLAADLERRVSDRTAELERATRQISEEKERLEAVHAITLELTTQLDLDMLIRQALELISRHVGVSRGSIMLRDPENDMLVCRAVIYDRGDARSANIPLRFESGEGLAGWVMRHQEPVNIPDVQIDERWVIESGRAEDVRSAAGVPLKTSDAALGVVILSSGELGYFTDSQMNQLGTIAGVVAAAVSNAQLYSFITELATRNATLLAEQREETSKSAAVFRSVTEGVIVLDTDQQITLFNPAAEQVLEIPSEALLGQPLTALEVYGNEIFERQRAQAIYGGLMSGLRHVRQSRQTYRTSLDLADPTQVIALSIAPVVGPDEQRYGDVAVLRDITREIEADEAKRQFVADVSHELRTPLTAIKGYVDVLLLSGSQSMQEEQVKYLGIIKNNTNRLKSLIEDILEFSRPDSKKRLAFSQVDIISVLSEVEQSMRLEYERKGMQVVFDIAPDVPPVTADQKRITQVIFNLFSNAVKYTYDGGTINVRVFLNRAGLLQFEVEDTGVGMSADQVKKLFRPFYRADNPLRDVAGGTGLGLSIAKQFVEQHGGEMWVTSELGHGSTFHFILPLIQNESAEHDEDVE
jgi:GAF domain-containing protein/anti-sigma regulatory factor (Ser/Thr protein kinase)